MRYVLAVCLILVGLGLLYFAFRHEGTSELSRSFGVAESIWGPVCGGKTPTVRTEGFAGDVAAEARWAYTQFPGGHREYTTCEIALDNRRWNLKGRRYCAVIVHEWGHLKMESRKHSTNPNSVMYPVLTNRNIPDAC